MAKAVLTFEDTDEGVNVDVNLDPPLGDGKELTDLSEAQQAALGMVLYFFPEDGEDVVYKPRSDDDKS